jgi:hypothetical protein
MLTEGKKAALSIRLIITLEESLLLLYYLNYFTSNAELALKLALI